MRKTCFILNPRSGHSARAVAPVRSFAAAHSAQVRLTERGGHARELAARAVTEGFDLVVAVGGDGTMNEVAAAVAGSPATFGLVSCGSGNGLGRHLGLHGSVARSLRILESGRPRAIDVGVAGGTPFFNVAGLGFEADLSERFNRLVRRGMIRYVFAGLAEWRLRRSREYRIEAPGHPAQLVRALSIVAANGTQYGNNVQITPRARIDDGLLDVIAIPPMPAPELLFRMLRGTIERHRHAHRWQSPQFAIGLPEPGLVQVDGETRPVERRLDLGIRPGGLRVLVPAGA